MVTSDVLAVLDNIGSFENLGNDNYGCCDDSVTESDDETLCC